jgi:hypothetical protein
LRTFCAGKFYFCFGGFGVVETFGGSGVVETYGSSGVMETFGGSGVVETFDLFHAARIVISRTSFQRFRCYNA